MPGEIDAEARLRAAGISDPGHYLRKLKEAGGDFDAMLTRVCAGEPLYRVIGKREFHGLDYALSSETLEPRDDTESLISAVLDRLPDPSAAIRIADLGTGTGIVALSLLAELPNAHATATDISNGALATAQANAASLGLADRFDTIQGSWLDPLSGAFNVIVSNPPYIATHIVDTLDPHVRDHDPRAALDGGADGLDAYRVILNGAASFLVPDGFLALEIGYDQCGRVSALARAHGWNSAGVHKDLGGHDRALVFRPTEK